MNIVHINRFYRIVFVSLVTIYLVILAGGIVRSTGSGMGCPDWPKCFGTYAPPLEESQLPADYKEKYAVQGHPAVFNVYKTWTEYVNRLVGAIAGLIIVYQCIYATRFLKTTPKYFWYSLLLAVLMASQGLLGAKLVSSYLKPILITLHMGVALLIMGILIWLLVEAGKEKQRLHAADYAEEDLGRKYRWAMWVFISLTVIQIFLGTEVRETIDIISYALDYQYKETWIASAGSIFIIHRSYSILLTAATIYFTFILYKQRALYPKAYRLSTKIAAVIAIEIAAGITLAYFALPPWAQPIHLLFATVLLGVQLAFVFRFMVGQNRRSV
ncbi:COX15/CtaA family protein [Cytophaga hutchinsonii]|uniref:Cytochrome oxidase assembly protein n=1 Tax=Cytophaga hutchinsonii (strain ATCC 33406 / DSM 1761 / CIP 103989 / NBRC 15051 / NCIMB 9469 / D465) TaxID=269798 RepID=A0A6N4SSW2_CYTH3|nr:COX15/CtaA family protein [Cytophaga hutchinsonii]ABG59468.1 cytochrome oxidase assembly protein [Cytophaga hutchinsonii ATCC 33406]SFX96625.1 cytochrome c oxidase assembly protein subunit 15 [Cytophaga hutchinsonii ATCC 33406]